MKKQIKEYNNYFIYDNGEVFNSNTNKLLQGSISENGYKYYRLSKNNSKKMFYAHRLVAEYFIPNPSNLPIVNHKDGNKLNNEVSNLEWTTYSKNIEHWHKNLNKKERVKTEKYLYDLEGEEWTEILDFPNYKIFNKGRIRNIKTNILLHPVLTSGYYKVRLSKENKTKDELVHYLVYQSFTKDYEKNRNYVIDHKDGNKQNNELSNLRKITLSENVLSALYITKINKSGKPISQYDKNEQFIATYPSSKEASRQLKLDSSSIIKNCKGKLKTCGGFIFKYA